jgi:hypothetical protein
MMIKELGERWNAGLWAVCFSKIKKKTEPGKTGVSRAATGDKDIWRSKRIF